MIWRNALRNHSRNNRVAMLVHACYLWDARVRREAEALAEAGFKVDVVSVSEPDQPISHRYVELVKGVRVHRLPIKKKRGGFWRYLFEYAATLILGGVKLTILYFRCPYSVVHIHNMPDLFVLAGIIPKLCGAKMILDVHDPMAEHYQATHHLGPRNWVVLTLRVFEKLSYLIPDEIISVSETMRERLEQRGTNGKKVTILHNVPDWKIFPPKTLVDSWKRPKDGLTLLYSGTITEHYRLDIALKALAHASNVVPGLKLKILGSGNRLPRLTELAQQLGVEKQIEFLGRVAIDDVKKVLEGADVGISTHQAGEFGDLYFSTKILEFMSQGLPVISSRTKTIARYIPESAIFFFEPENVDDMVKQIVKIWNEPDTVSKKITNAMLLVQQYSWEKEKVKLLELYQKITGLEFENSQIKNAIEVENG
jgi:glycosyltransferase involved in cell wall biosynthesis